MSAPAIQYLYVDIDTQGTWFWQRALARRAVLDGMERCGAVLLSSARRHGEEYFKFYRPNFPDLGIIAQRYIGGISPQYKVGVHFHLGS